MNASRSNRSAWSVVVLLLCATSFSPVWGQIQQDFAPNLSLLVSPTATGTLDLQRARLALWYSAQELKVADRAMPRIVVVHGSPESVRTVMSPNDRPAGSDNWAVVIWNLISPEEKLYYAWVVGAPSDQAVVNVMAHVLAMQFGATAEAEHKAAQRVINRLAAITSVDALRQRNR